MTGSVVRVRGLKRFVDKRDGRTYCYHRATGRRLKAEYGTPEFFSELAAIERSYQAKRKTDESPQTLEDLIRRYLASHNYRELAPRTRKDYQGLLFDLINLGQTPLLSTIDTPFMVALRDTYAKHRGWRRANYLMCVLSNVFNLGLECGAVVNNPTRGLSRLKRPRDLEKANRPWSDAERIVILNAASPHLRLPLALADITGMRISDIVALPKRAIQKGWIIHETQKRQVEICIPLTPELKAEILRAPAHQAETLCANSRGQSWTVDGLRTVFHKLKVELLEKKLIGPGLTFHGLRHRIASDMAENGANDGDIANWLGQKTSAIARHYSARADKKRRVEATVIKLEQTKGERAKGERDLSGKSQ